MSRGQRERFLSRRKRAGIFSGAVFCIWILASVPSYAFMPELSAQDAQSIAERVFQNECHAPEECLMEWNEGEDFLSLGLGHFIWYPEKVSGIFEESFRAYLQYVRETGGTLPGWLDQASFPPCPWGSREHFLLEKKRSLYQDLADFIIQSRHRQAEFIIRNVKAGLQGVIDAAHDHEKPRIQRDIERLAAERQGVYAMMDYINFKGTGLRGTEAYSGQGWGLLQVLRNMQDSRDFRGTLEEFARSAREILTRRVENSPRDRGEERWLPGWLKRVDTYVVSGI